MRRLSSRGAFLALMLPCLLAPSAWAGDSVKVDGSDNTFKKKVTREVGKEKKVPMKLTGVGLREKAWFNVYAIASYIKEDAKVKTASQLAGADTPKMLILILERDVDGEDMASAFKDAIRANYKKGFNTELKAIAKYFKPKTCRENVKIQFVHIPGVGLLTEVTGHKPLMIKNVKFAKAMWDVYLGKENVDCDIKEGLVKRLK